MPHPIKCFGDSRKTSLTFKLGLASKVWQISGTIEIT